MQYLDFEKPIEDLTEQLEKLKKIGENGKVDVRESHSTVLDASAGVRESSHCCPSGNGRSQRYRGSVSMPLDLDDCFRAARSASQWAPVDPKRPYTSQDALPESRRSTTRLHASVERPAGTVPGKAIGVGVQRLPKVRLSAKQTFPGP